MTPEEQKVDDIAWLQGEIARWGIAAREAEERARQSRSATYRQRNSYQAAYFEKEAARCARFLAALTAPPVAWRIEGEEVNEEWSGAFDCITDDARGLPRSRTQTGTR